MRALLKAISLSFFPFVSVDNDPRRSCLAILVFFFFPPVLAKQGTLRPLRSFNFLIGKRERSLRSSFFLPFFYVGETH